MLANDKAAQMVEPSKKGEVTIQMVHIEETISELENVLDRLEIRLAPITCPAPKTAETDRHPESDTSTSAGANLQRQVRRLLEINGRLNTLLTCCEL